MYNKNKNINGTMFTTRYKPMHNFMINQSDLTGYKILPESYGNLR